MADRTSNAPLRLWPNAGDPQTEKIAMNGGTAVTGYKGEPLIYDASTDTDVAVRFTSSITAAAGDVFVGIAAAGFSIATTDNDGDVKVTAYVSPSVVGFASSVFTEANKGDTAYMDDSGTLTATGTANLRIGKVVAVEDGYVYVELSAPYVLTSADVA